jgi:molybdopterin biosynthesis enzyme
MINVSRPVAVLTGLDAVLARLLDGCRPVAPIECSVAAAIGCVAATMPSLTRALPVRNIAVVDGWALNSMQLTGASSYSPVPLAVAPTWVEVGDALPEGCDCVLDVGTVESAGPLNLALAEAIPGAGVRRAGEDFAAGTSLITAGHRIRNIDGLMARRAGLHSVAVHRPRVHIINIPAADGLAVTAHSIVESIRVSGAQIARTEASARDAASIAKAIKGVECDLLVTIGGTGAGHRDATVEALASCASLVAHGIALQPGRTTAVAKLGDLPVISIPGAADHALAAWWAVGQPVLDRLSGRAARPRIVRPLARKIASGVGMTDVVLLKDTDAGWMPLAIGDLPLGALTRADAWLVVPSGVEGYAAGSTIGAYSLQESL